MLYWQAIRHNYKPKKCYLLTTKYVSFQQTDWWQRRISHVFQQLNFSYICCAVQGHNVFSIYRIILLEYGILLKILTSFSTGMFFLMASFLPYAMRLRWLNTQFNSTWDIWSFSTIDSFNNRDGRDGGNWKQGSQKWMIGYLLISFCGLLLKIFLCWQNRNGQRQWFTSWASAATLSLWQCSCTNRHVFSVSRWFSKGRSSV